MIQRINVQQCECNDVDCDVVYDYYTDKGQYVRVSDLLKRLGELVTCFDVAQTLIDEISPDTKEEA